MDTTGVALTRASTATVIPSATTIVANRTIHTHTVGNSVQGARTVGGDVNIPNDSCTAGITSP